MREMVKKFFRKANSLLLAAAMTVTMIPAQAASAAGTEDTAVPGIVQQADEGTDVSSVVSLDVDAIEGKEYTVIKGNTPVLPKRANVSADNGIAATEIQWTGLDSLDEGEQTVTGTAGGTTITVKVNVLHCDEVVGDVQAMGLGSDTYQEKRDAIHPLKGYKGKFVTEYDIVPNDVKHERDRAVIYLPAADKDGEAFSSESAWDYGARLQFKYGSEDEAYFQTQIGDGQDMNEAVYYPTNEAIAAALEANQEIAMPFKKVNTYHVRTEMDTTTDTTKGNVKIYITDPDGIEHEVTQPNGNGFRIYPTDGVVKNFAAMRGGYRLVNHKVSWISGYAIKKTETYLKAKGATDYVKEDGAVETKEVPDYVANQKPTADIVKDGISYTLDTEKSGWYNGDTKVDSITVAADDTVTYRAYYKDAEEAATIAAKDAMDTSVAAAEKKVEEENEADYTPASWTALTDALAACNALTADATKQDYVDKKAVLDAAMAGLTKRADKTELTQAIGNAEALNDKQADYTAESWSAMQDKLTAAKEVEADPDAAQTAVNTAKTELLEAVENLTLAEVKVDSITPKKKTYSVKAGEKLDLKTVFTVGPQNAENKTLTYSIDKKYKSYASVNKTSGVVTTTKKGAGQTIEVKATAADGSGKSGTVKIKITKVAVKKVAIKGSKSVKAGKKVTLKANVTPKDATNTSVTWSIAKKYKKYASVTSKGVVKTKKAGKGKTIKVTATSKDNKKKKATISIKIK